MVDSHPLLHSKTIRGPALDKKKEGIMSEKRSENLRPDLVSDPNPPGLDHPPAVSARRLHEILVTAHTGGNVARRRFIDALRALAESRLYLALGYPSIAAYGDAAFRLRRTQVYEFLRVSRALAELPRLGQAFERGEISWSLLAELSRVASAETEAEWIAFASERPIEAVLAEAADARRKNRRHPRRDAYGLPAMTFKLSFEFGAADFAVIESALAKVASEMAAGLGGARPSDDEALLYLMNRILASDPEGSVTPGRRERELSPFSVVFHQCPDCRRAAVETGSGRVEVASEAIERLAGEDEGSAPEGPSSAAPAAGEAPRRDGPNTPALRRALALREGGRCANPCCRRPIGSEGHAHHVVFRSRGGPTTIENEIWLCARCHGLVHAGVLEVSGDPESGLRWRARASDLTREVRTALEEILSVPRVEILEMPAGRGGSSSSGGPDERKPALFENVLPALERLGWSRAEAEARLRAAHARLSSSGGPPEAVDASTLLREAIRERPRPSAREDAVRGNSDGRHVRGGLPGEAVPV